MKRFLAGLAGLLVVLLIYAGSYFALVVPSNIGHVAGLDRGQILARRNAEYRVGGEVAATIFTPMHALDFMVLRPRTWYLDPVPR